MKVGDLIKHEYGDIGLVMRIDDREIECFWCGDGNISWCLVSSVEVLNESR